MWRQSDRYGRDPKIFDRKRRMTHRDYTREALLAAAESPHAPDCLTHKYHVPSDGLCNCHVGKARFALELATLSFAEQAKMVAAELSPGEMTGPLDGYDAAYRRARENGESDGDQVGLSPACSLCRQSCAWRSDAFAGSALGSCPVSSICPVAICMTWTASQMTSAGRFWPWDTLGILVPCFEPLRDDAHVDPTGDHCRDHNHDRRAPRSGGKKSQRQSTGQKQGRPSEYHKSR